MHHEYFEIDVFAATAFSGNPVAVVSGADELTTDQMHSIARWTNFSETVFLLQPTDTRADYRVRIFTPHEEFPFAGHPTLGAARAWRALGNEPHKHGEIIQECGIGLITVQEESIRNHEGNKQQIFSFATPELTKSGPLSDEELDSVCIALNIEHSAVVAHSWGDNGPGWKFIQLAHATDVQQLHPQPHHQEKIGVFGFTEDGNELYEVRAFIPGREDPATGSLNGAIAQFLRAQKLAPESYTAAQGSQLQRNAVIHIFDDGKNIWVGGLADIRVAGTLSTEQPLTAVQ